MNKNFKNRFLWLSFILLYSATMFGRLHAQNSTDSAADNKNISLEDSSDDVMSDEEFKRKLSEMYNRINKSLQILRDQITSNQSAPFLANLYMQLGDMLMQKSNVLYYIKMETIGNNPDEDTSKKLKDVVDATKEATAIYDKVLKEFPKFTGRSRAYYQLALALKSIDETPRFLEVVNELIKLFPGTKDGVKGQLLLGQHLFERGLFDEAIKIYVPITSVNYAYERNQAKYKMGIIKITEDKHKEALDYFVQVITDKDLKDEDNEAEVNLKKKNVKTDLKREALIDSVRAYTEVFKTGVDAVKFYSNIAPTENLFQEVIEKLAFRYINLKQYNDAIKLLRTLSERTSSPDKALSIYKEVLLMIPLNDRVNLPVSEIRFVLEKYVQWRTFYKLPQDVARSAEDFFEKQLRDLGTRSHEMGKDKTNPEKSLVYLKNATEFYELYMALFPKTKYSMKMALNTADANFRMSNYLRCGDYYLRAYKSEWGQVAAKHKALVIKNAVYCLQKEKEYSFYELRRVKGLLIESLKLLMDFDPSKKNDPKTNFTLAKAIYDQGFYQPAMSRLLEFMKKYPTSSYATDAANLIMDYFNIKSDFQGLMDWGQKILALNLPNAALNSKVKQIREQAKYKKLQAQVESSSSFDGFAQGKSYLNNAANIQNVELRNLALSRALEASKREKDIGTFFKAASSIAAKEPDSGKRAEIELSMAQEHVKMSNYSEAKPIYRKVMQNSSYGDKYKQNAYNDMITMALALRDWDMLAGLVSSQQWSGVSSQSKQQASELVGNAFESPLRITSAMSKVALRVPATPTLALGLIKAGSRLSGNLQSLKNSTLSQICSGSNGAAACRWQQLSNLDRSEKTLVASLSSSNGDLGSMEKLANDFAMMLQKYAQLEGGEDPSLDVVTSLRQADLYGRFGIYLRKVSQVNAQVAPMIAAKSQEAMQTAKSFKLRCQKVIDHAGVVSSVNKYCRQGGNPTMDQALTWEREQSVPAIKEVPKDSFMPIKKNIFSVYEAVNILKLAESFMQMGAYHYATATSIYGLSLGVQQDVFNTILGCSVMQLGHLSEASFYLKNGSDFNGYKGKCLSRLQAMVR